MYFTCLTPFKIIKDTKTKKPKNHISEDFTTTGVKTGLGISCSV